MATSKSVAMIVSDLSGAESLTHCSEGLGVREATTVPATFRASRSAPRLQITFMSSAFPSSSFSPSPTGPPNVQPLLHYQKTLDSISGNGVWRIVDNSYLFNVNHLE